MREFFGFVWEAFCGIWAGILVLGMVMASGGLVLWLGLLVYSWVESFGR